MMAAVVLAEELFCKRYQSQTAMIAGGPTHVGRLRDMADMVPTVAICRNG